MSPNDPFLGRGWSFPPVFDKETGEVKMTVGVEDIHRSLEIILTTALGERLMQPAFGSSLEDMLFEPLNTSSLTYVENLLKTAILYHEPRIDADAVEVRPDDREGLLQIHISFRVRSTNSRFNFVYPFYLSGAGT